MEQMLGLFNVFFNESLLIKSSLMQSISNSPEINNDLAELLQSFMEIQLQGTRDAVYSKKLAAFYCRIKNQVIVGMTRLFVNPCDMVLNALFSNPKILIQFI